MVEIMSQLYATPANASTISGSIGHGHLNVLQDPGNHSLCILLTVSLGGHRRSETHNERWSWLLQLIKQTGVRAKVIELSYHVDASDDTVWQTMVVAGDALLNSLSSLDATHSISARPMILASYGLGGIPLKRALSKLCERYYDPKAQTLLNSLRHVIFISCPHLQNNQESVALSKILLKNELGLRQTSISAASEEVAIAARVCSKFSEHGPYCPVTTTFETEPPKPKKFLKSLSKSKRPFLSKELTTTKLRTENMVELDLYGQGLKSLNCTSSSFATFAKWLEQTLQQCEKEKDFLNSTAIALDNLHVSENIFESTVDAESVAQGEQMPEDDQVGQLSKQTTFSSQAKATYNSSSSGKTDFDFGTINESRPATLNLPCFAIGNRPRNPNFTGRDEIFEKMDACLLPRVSQSLNREFGSLQLFGLYGMGGIGKTQAACEYVYSRRDKFDAVFWIQADKPTVVAESFGDIALKLGVASLTDVNDLTVSFNLMLKWLLDPKKPVDSGDPVTGAGVDFEVAHWLLVFDNADNIDVLRDYWPSTGVGSILITSRDPEAKIICEGQGYELRALSEDENELLFDKLLNFDRSELNYSNESVKQLVKRFGGIPLATVHISSLILRHSMTTDEFVEIYDRDARSAGLGSVSSTRSDIHYQHTLFTVWLLERMNKSTRSLLGVLALLSPWSIPEALLTADIEAVAEPVSYPWQKSDYYMTRSSLLKASLVERDIGSKQLSIHPLVQEIVQAHLADEELLSLFSIAVELLYAARPIGTTRWHHHKSHTEKIAELAPHSLQLQSIFATRESTFASKWQVGQPKESVEKWLYLLNETGWYLYERGEHESAQQLMQSLISLAEKHRNENPDPLADALMTMTAISPHVFQPLEIRSCGQKHLEIRQEIAARCQKPYPEEVKCKLVYGYGNRAMTLMVTGDYEEAIVHAWKAVEICHSTKTFTEVVVPYVLLACIGWCLWSLNRSKEAEPILLEAIEAHKKVTRPSSYGLGCVGMPLGSVKSALGKHDEAFETHTEAFEAFFAANGNNHKTGQARLKLAEHLERLERYTEAWQHYGLAISAYSNRKHYLPELARANWLAAEFQIRRGNRVLATNLRHGAQMALDQANTRLDVSLLELWPV